MRPKAPRPTGLAAPPSSLLVCTLALVLGVCTFCAYAPSFRGVLVLDDIRAIARNSTIASLWPLSTPLSPPSGSTVAARPIANLSFALNYAMAPPEARDAFIPGDGNGPRPSPELVQRNLWGYHLLNLLIHWAAGLTLFGIVRRTLLSTRLHTRFAGSATGLAFAAAALWLLHPLQTAAVTYVVQRVESLMGLFYLVTVYFAIRASDGGRTRLWTAGAVVSCGLGMATKEVMVTAPLVVALWDWMFSGRESRRVRWPLVAMLASTWVVLAALVAHEPRGPSLDLSLGTSYRYLLTQFEVMARYLLLAVLPWPLVFFYSWPLADSLRAVAAPAALVTTLAALTVYGTVRRNPVAFAGAWFLLILAPSSSFLPIVTEVAAEHRMYLPLAAVVTCAVVGGWTGLAWVASRIFTEPHMRRQAPATAGLALVGAAAIACVLMTRARNEAYSSAERLWRDTVEKRPANFVARVAYAEALATARHLPESETELRQALVLLPNSPLALVRLGSVVAAEGRLEDAIALWEQAARSQPDDVDAHRMLARAYAMRRQEPLAVRHLQQALEVMKDDPALLEQLAVILAGSQDPSVRNPARSVALAERAAQVTARRDARALEILAIALNAAGRTREASATAREAAQTARLQGDEPLASQLESRAAAFESAASVQPPR